MGDTIVGATLARGDLVCNSASPTFTYSFMSDKFKLNELGFTIGWYSYTKRLNNLCIVNYYPDVGIIDVTGYNIRIKGVAKTREQIEDFIKLFTPKQN